MSGLLAASERAAIAGEGGPASRARRAGLLMPQSWTLDAFRERLPRPHKLEGRGFRCPCPIHGGTDRAWIRPGGRVAVMGGCNSGCKLPDMARAIGLLASGQPDVFAMDPIYKGRRPMGGLSLLGCLRLGCTGSGFLDKWTA